MTNTKQVNRTNLPWANKRVTRIDIPPEKVRDVIAPWVLKVLLRIKQEEAMKKQASGGEQ